MSQLLAEKTRRDHSRSGAGFDHIDWLVGGSREREHAAAALHDQQFGGEAAFSQPVFNPIEVSSNDRLNAGVDDGCAGPEVFPELRRDVG